MSFDSKHYVPILKCKEGELSSLRNLAPVVKDGLTPVVEVMPVPWDFDKDQPLKSLDDHLRPVAEKILRAWGNEQPMFIDAPWIDATDTVADGRTTIAYVLDDARRVGLKAIPVTGLNRDVAYQTAVKAAVKTDGLGTCLRLERDDLDDSGALKPLLDSLLKDFGLTPAHVDLLIDFRDVVAGQANTLALAAGAVISGAALLS